MSIAKTRDMPLATRLAGLWLAVCSLGVGVAFSVYQYQFLPDFYVVSWLGHTAWLFLVAAIAASLCSRTVVRSKPRALAVLVVGHLTAMVSTYVFLNSRIHCVGGQNWIEYWVPDDTGAFILLGPTLAVVLVSAVAIRPTRHCS